MRKTSIFVALAAVAALATVLLAAPAMAGMPFNCYPSGVGIGEIHPDAQVATLYCFYKKYEGAKSLHVKVGVRNMAKTAKRFRVNIFLPGGKAVGGLIPRKTKKGLVAPGATGSFTYPVKGYSGPTDAMEIYVKPLGN